MKLSLLFNTCVYFTHTILVFSFTCTSLVYADDFYPIQKKLGCYLQGEKLLPAKRKRNDIKIIKARIAIRKIRSLIKSTNISEENKIRKLIKRLKAFKNLRKKCKKLTREDSIANEKSIEEGLKNLRSSAEKHLPEIIANLEKVLAFETLEVQDALDSYLPLTNLSEDKKQELRKSQEYFNVIRDYVQALKNKDSSYFLERNKDILQSHSFNWSSEFLHYTQEKKYTLPFLEILQISTLPLDGIDDLPDKDLLQLGKDLEHLYTNDYDSYLQTLTQSSNDLFYKTTADMRRVKADILFNVDIPTNDIAEFPIFTAHMAVPDPQLVTTKLSNRHLGLSRHFIEPNGERRSIENMLETIDRSRQNKPDSIIWLDDGFWGILSEDELLERIKAMRERFPGDILGIYSFLPKNDFHAHAFPKDSERYLGWLRENERLMDKFSEYVDIIYMSFYTLHPLPENMDLWKNSVKSRLAEAKRVSKMYNEQKVLAWAWPDYHSNGNLNPLAFRAIEGRYFYDQMDTILKEGVSGLMLYNYKPWNDNLYNLSDSNYTWYEALSGIRSNIESGTYNQLFHSL